MISTSNNMKNEMLGLLVIVRRLLIALLFLLPFVNSYGMFDVTRATQTGKFKVVMIGASSIGKMDGTCLAASSSNNDAAGNIGYVTKTGGISTTSSESYSSATVTESMIPAGCSKLVHAYLYWGGSNYGQVNEYWNNAVYLEDPNGVEHSVNAIEHGSTENVNGHDCTPYWAYADVSSIVQAGNFSTGTYAVRGVSCDIDATSSEGGAIGGWCMVMIFENPRYPQSQFYLYDGASAMGTIANGLTPTKTKNVTFNTVATGDITGAVGMAAFDGDVGDKADQVYFQTTNGTEQDLNALRGTSDFFSSTMTCNGVQVTHTPNCVNTIGFDAHHIDFPQGAVTNSDNSATVTVKTEDSFIAPFMMYVCIYSEVPHLVATKTASSSTVKLGETYKYYVTLENDGGTATAASPATTLVDTIDYNIDLVDGTVKYTLGGVSTTATYDYNSTTRVLTIKNLPSIPAGEKLVISYQAKVKDATRADLWREECMQTIYNKATATYYNASDVSTPLYAYTGETGCGTGKYTIIPIASDFSPYEITEVTHNVIESNGSILLNTYLNTPALSDELGTTDYAVAGTDGTPTYTFYTDEACTSKVGAATYMNVLPGATKTYYAKREVTTMAGKGKLCPDVIKINLIRATCKLTDATVDATDALCNGAKNGTISLMDVTEAQNMTDGCKFSLYKGTYTTEADLPTGAPFVSYATTTKLTHTFENLAAGDYTVVFTDGLDCKIVKNGTIKEPDPITVTITHTNACIGSRVRFTATAAGGTSGTKYAYTWYRSSDGSSYTEDASQGDGNTYDVTSNQSKIYVKAVASSTTAECNNAVCTGEGTDMVELSVKPDLSMLGTKICKGESFTLSPTDAKTATIANYTWKSSADSSAWTTIYDKETASTYKTYKVTPEDSIYYRVIFTTAGGCADSAAAKVAVFPVPVIKDTTITICSGNSFSYTPIDGATDGTNTDIVPKGTTYKWMVGTNANVSGSSDETTGVTNISQTLTSSSNAAQTVVYTVTPKTEHPCTGATFTVTVTVNPKPAITDMAATQCSGTTFTAKPVNGTDGTVPSGTTYTWAAPTVAGVTGMTAGSGALTISQTLTNTTTVAVDVVYTVTPKSGDCEGDPFKVTFTVNPLPDVTITNPAAICQDAGTINLEDAVAVSNYTVGTNCSLTFYKDAAATTIQSNHTISAAGTASYYVTATSTSGCKSLAKEIPVTIYALPAAPTNNGDKTFCEASTVPDLSVTVGTGETADWYDVATGGTAIKEGSTIYTPAAPASAGSVTYYVSARNTTTDCVSATRTAVKLTMTAKPVAPTGSEYSSCPSTAAGTKTWKSLVSNYTGTLNWYTAADVATTDPGSFPTQTEMTLTTYKVSQTINGCESDPVTITAKINNVASAPTVTPYSECAAATSTTKTWSSLVTTTGTNTWYSADGTTALGGEPAAFDVSTKLAKTTYQVTVTDANGCVSPKTDVSAEVKARPTAKISGDATICSDATGTTSLTVTFTGTPNFTYTLDDGTTNGTATSISQTIDMANPGTTKTYKIATLSDENCTAVDADLSGSATITVTPKPTVTIDYTSPICSSVTSDAVTLSGTNAYTGGSYTSTPTGLSIDATTGKINPSASTAGKIYTVTYATLAANGCTSVTATKAVTITALPTITKLEYTGTPFCSTVTSATPTLEGTSLTGGSYASTPTGLSIDATGVIDPSNSTAGTYTVTYTIPAAAGCDVVSKSTTVKITKAPTTTISYTTPLCSSAAVQDVTLTGTDAYAGGTYSSSASGLTLDPSSGTITPSSSTAGAYTVTYKTPEADGCTSISAQADVTITALPVINTFTYAGSPFCSTVTSGAPTLSGMNIPSSGVTYTSATGLSIDESTGVIDPSASTAGTYTVICTIPAAGGCSAVTKTTDIIITTMPAASISYAATYCKSLTTAQPVTLTGKKGGTYASSTGLIVDSSTGSITPSTSTSGDYEVTYTIVAADGCPEIAPTATLKIAAVPTIAVSTAATCDADKNHYSVVLTVSDGTVTATAGTVTNATGSLWKVADITTGTPITATVTTADGCMSTKDIMAPDCSCDVIAAPTGITSFEYCDGATIPTLTVASSNSIKYGITWYDAATDGTVLKSNSTTYAPTAPGTYYAEAYEYATESTTKCHSDRIAFTITKNPRPTATLTEDKTICKGGSATLNVDLTGTAPFNYILSDGTTATAATIAVSPIATTTYTVTALSDAHCTANAGDMIGSVTITVTDKPEVSNMTAPAAVCDGDNLTLASPAVTDNGATATGIFKMSTAVGGSTYAELASPYMVAYVDNGKSLIYTATNSCGTVSNDPVTITVNKKPTIGTLASIPAVCSGSTLTLTAPTVTEYGSAATSKNWEIGDGTAYVTFDPATSVTTADNGKKMRYVVVSGCGTVYSDPQTITVNALPTGVISGTNTVCADVSTTSLIFTFTGSPAYTYKYSDGTNETDKTSTTNSASFDVAPSKTTTYTLISLKDNNGCEATDLTGSAVVTVNSVPVITENTAPTCSADLLTYTVKVNVTDGESVTATGGTVANVGDVYTVSGITKGADITITAKGIAPTACAATYPVTAPNCDCPIIAAPASEGDKEYCDGSAIATLLVAVPTTDNYYIDWYDASNNIVSTGSTASTNRNAAYMPTTGPAAGTSVTYYAQIHDILKNCRSSKTAVKLTNNARPTAAISGDVTVCGTTAKSLTVNLTGNGIYSYQLKATDANGSSNSTESATSISVSPTITTAYTITALSDAKCLADLTKDVTGSATITVNQVPAIANIGTPAEVCDGSNLALTAPVVTKNGSVITSEGFELSTTVGGTTFASLADPYKVTYADNGKNLRYTATNACGTTTSNEVTITVNQVPEVGALTAPAAVCSGKTLSLTIPAITNHGSTISSQGWEVGDGTTYSAFDPTTVVDYDNYNGKKMRYVVVTGCGTVYSDLQTITINALPTANIVVDGTPNICYGENTSLKVTFTGATPYTFTYGTAVGTYNETASASPYTINVGPDKTLTYTIKSLTDNNGCVSVSSGLTGAATVTVNPIPSVSIVSKPCAADYKTYTVYATIKDASSVETSFTDVAQALNASNSKGNVSYSGNDYTISGITSGVGITIKAVGSTPTSCTKELEVSAPNCTCPKIDAPTSGGDQSYCDYATPTIPSISATAPTGDDLVVDWYTTPTGGTAVLEGSNTYSPGAVGTYYAETRNTSSGCVSDTRTAVTISKNVVPTVTLTGAEDGDKITCTTPNYMLGYMLSSETAQSQKWNDNSTMSTLSIATAGTYSVTVTTTKGCVAKSNEIELSLDKDAPKPVIAATIQTLTCTNPKTNLSMAAVTSATYQWSKDAADISGATSNEIDNVADVGDYKVTITYANGCSATSDAMTIGSDKTADKPAISADYSTLTCTNPTAKLSSSTAGSAYAWTKDGAAFGSNNQAVETTDNGKYTVKVTYANGCSATSDEFTEGIDKEKAVISGNKEVCVGSNITLSSSLSTGTGWKSDDETVATITAGGTVAGVAAGQSYITYTGANGCVSESYPITVIAQSTITLTSGSDAQTLCSVDNKAAISDITYTLGGGATGATATGLPADVIGTYNSSTKTFVISGDDKLLGTSNYTVTTTNNAVCASVNKTGTITTNATPSAPSVTPSVACATTGTKSWTDLVTLATGATLNWYDASGTAISAPADIDKSVAGTLTYKVSQTLNGCEGSKATVTATVYPLPTATISGDNTICNGSSSTLTIGFSNGTSPYSYKLVSGENGDNIIASTTDVEVTPTITTTYQLSEIKDKNGCAATVTTLAATSATITVNPTPTANAGVDQTIDGICRTATTATTLAAISPTVGSGAWSFVSGTTTPTIMDASQYNTAVSGLGIGSYTFRWTVTSGMVNACVATDDMTITVNPDLKAPDFTQGAIADQAASRTANDCEFAVPNVLNLVSASDDHSTAAQLSFSQNPLAGTVITGATTVVVTVTDACGNANTQNINITVPEKITATAKATKNVSCNGGSDGVAEVTPKGGSNSYTYIWKDANASIISSATSAMATGLMAGTYTVVVTDDNKCSTTVNNIVVTQPDVIKATFEAVSPKCKGESGSIKVISVTGGSGSYEYSLDQVAWSSLAANSSIPNISSVSTTIYVRDAAVTSCIQSFSVDMKIPSALTTSADWKSDVTCKGLSDGSAIATAQGGTGNYTYAWNDASNNVVATSQNPTTLAAGTFTVTVTDENACHATSSSITIKEPDAVLSGTVVATAVKCNDGDDGSAIVTAIGGTTPYSYLWDTNASSQTTNTASSLKKGSYSVTVTDANGCKASVTTVIGQPTALTVKIDATKTEKISCNGKYDGSLTAVVEGGTPTYSYQWNDDKASTTAAANDLEAGDYTINVTDANGCTASATVSLTNPSAIVVITSPINPKCYGGAGYATVNISGGTSDQGTYQCSTDGGVTWSNITSGGKTQELAAGTYTVTIKDANGCEGSGTVTITQPAQMSVEAKTISNIKCNGEKNGTAALSVDNAAKNQWTCVWYNESYQSVTTLSRPTTLPAGKYFADITDGNGCAATTNWIEITEPTAITVSSELVNPECPDQTSSLNVDINGGTITNGYKYVLNGSDTLSIPAKGTVMNIPLAAFQVVIMDDNNCKAPVISGNAKATDNTPPVVVCHDDMEVEPTKGTCSYTISGTTFDVQYNDNCSIKSVTHDYALASNKTTLANAVITGNATITWTVTDVMNNTSTCKTKITVSDLEKPVIGKPVVDDTLSVPAVYVTGSSCKFTVPNLTEIVQKVSTDNCTGQNDLQIQQTLAMGATIPATITNNMDIYVSVIDEAGNQSLSSVIKIIMPTIPKATLNLTADQKTVCSNAEKFLLPGGTEPTSTFTGTYSGTGSVGNYFSPSVAGVGTHTVTYTVSPYGCASSASGDIMVLQAPTVTLPNASAVCPNTDLEFDAVTSPVGNNTYSWTINGKKDATQTTSKYIVDNTAVSGTYTVGVVSTDEFGCSSNIVKATGLVNSNPIDPEVKVCSICQYSGSKTWPSLVRNSSGTLKWYDSETSITPISTPSIINDSVLGMRTYWVSTISDAQCESNKMKVTATVNSNPEVVSIMSHGIKDVEVSVDQGTSPYIYNLGSSMTGTFTRTAELGTLSIGSFKIAISDANGCTVDTTIVIEPVELQPAKYFTPNGDGINDLWTIEGIDYYPNSDIYIHDRYGKELAHFKGSDFTGWDGKYKGNEQVSTDYWYVILVKETGKRKVGHFLLKR